MPKAQHWRMLPARDMGRLRREVALHERAQLQTSGGDVLGDLRWMACSLTLLVFLAFVPANAHARLTWTSTELSLQPTTEQIARRQTVAQFPFRNEGGKPVSIQTVTASCNCSSAVPDQVRYEPGQSGRITLTLDWGDRAGPQFVQVEVKTDDPASDATLLLRINLPELPYRMEPRLVFWRVGEKPQARRVRLSARSSSERVQLVRVRGEGEEDAFDIEHRVIDLGRRYEIVITPRSTASPRNERITVELKIGSAGSSKSYLMARILEAP